MGNEQSANKGGLTQSSSAGSEIGKAEAGQKKSSGIVVVGTGQDTSFEESDSDSYISRLNTCPTFQPIAGVGSSTLDVRPQQGDQIAELNWKAAVKASTRLQEHLRACAEAVSFDQNSLTAQIKQLDQQSNQVLLKYTERQKAYAKHAEHTRKLDEVSASLKRVRMRLDATFSMLDELNKFLPEEDRIKIE